MTQQRRQILMTAALPYANGMIHLGHMTEYLQADFWSRFQNMRGHECLYFCADDTHGTPVMVEARRRQISPEQLIAEKWKEHTEDFAQFEIQFTHFSSTNSEENKQLCQFIFLESQKQGHISTRSIDQLYCPHDKMFLPDRFVKGTCPKCQSKNQYGDNCDVCGATYSPSEMKDAACSVCGTQPIKKSTEHLFFELNHFQNFLKEWLPQHTSKEVSRKMMEWFHEDLRSWDISRDEPYFGFEIPGYPGKYFYVWVDAPMGYVSTSRQWLEKQGRSWKEFWAADSKTEVYHLIGKDIVYFHTLFWPALLKSAGIRTPTQVFVHGHLTVDGEKMSKSKGTYISARTFAKHLNPLDLRYYFASKISSSVDDMDLNLNEFVDRVNSELVGKITNLASRGAQMLGKRFQGQMTQCDADGKAVLESLRENSLKVAEFFEARDFAKGLQLIREGADITNRYFDEKAPWKTAESEPEKTQQILTTTLNAFRLLSIQLKPILPSYVEKVEKLFGEKSYMWSDLSGTLENHPIQAYQMLAVRIDPVKVQAMVEDVKSQFAALNTTSADPKTLGSAKAVSSTSIEPIKPTIDIADFDKVDLRIALITAAEEVPQADKLLKLQVSLGNESRTIFAGIKSAYQNPSELVGKHTVIVANLAARKMKFGLSEGMVLAAGPGGKDLFILQPDPGAKPGDRVK